MRGDLRFRLPGISPSGRLRLSRLVGMPCSRAICSLFRLCAMSCTCTAQCINLIHQTLVVASQGNPKIAGLLTATLSPAAATQLLKRLSMRSCSTQRCSSAASKPLAGPA